MEGIGIRIGFQLAVLQPKLAVYFLKYGLPIFFYSDHFSGFSFIHVQEESEPNGFLRKCRNAWKRCSTVLVIVWKWFSYMIDSVTMEWHFIIIALIWDRVILGGMERGVG